MNAEAFLDSNLFVYMFDDTDPTKRQRASDLVSRSLEDLTGCISFQVVQETLNVFVHRLGVSLEDATQILEEVLIPLWQISPTPQMYRRGLRLQSRYGFSFYDSLIVAAALEAGCTRLYTEDLQHGQRIGQLTVVDPFRE